MSTFFNGTGFSETERRTFAPTFEGAQARRLQDSQKTGSSVMARRHARRDRRTNRAL